ncbi:MAG TPA: class I tRNA ligase family protein, partial [Nitrospiria bacterium]|nr:class I tRNA ligase family protein [Nitrospiria bacterium]
EGYRNFANKLWNAARFSLMNLPEKLDINNAPDVPNRSVSDRWILERLHRTVDSVNLSLRNYRFDDAAAALYQFTWHEFCDWYLELIKIDLQQETETQKAGTFATLASTFETILRLLHPFMPFITEELWIHFPHEGSSLTVAPFPQAKTGKLDDDSGQTINQVIGVVTALRTLRGEMNIPHSEELGAIINVSGEIVREQLTPNIPYIRKLGRISDIKIGVALDRPKAAARILTPFAEIYVPLDEARIHKEIERLHKVLQKIDKEIEPLVKKCADPNFIDKAPKEIVAKLERQRAEKHEEKLKLNTDLQRFKEMIS